MNQNGKKLALHWQIFIGILLGLLIGVLALQVTWGPTIVRDWIKPFGIIFIKLLKLIAVPLVFTSLAKGISDLKDLASLSKMGGKTVFWYLLTTVFAVMLGLVLVNLFQPGFAVDSTQLQQMAEYNTSSIDQKIKQSEGGGPLSFFVDVIPDNIFLSLGQNGSLLQVIFFTIFFSICLLLIPPDQSKVTKDLIDSLNHIMLKMVDIIILISPYAVVALIAALITETANPDLFKALMSYAGVLLLGMSILILLYPFLIKLLTGMPIQQYLRGILPAQLVAFTTSS
ncbi:MAG: cation:dicarboxylase symporter family transporter, partial [Bacteroidota bacterium]